jgi:hypothetical protein
LKAFKKKWKDMDSRETDSFAYPNDLSRHFRASPIRYILDHQYTEAGLGYAALKRSDRAKAEILLRAGFPVQLAILNHHQSGWADQEGYDADYTMGDILETDTTAEHVTTLPDGKPTDKSFDVYDDEIIPKGKSSLCL